MTGTVLYGINNIYNLETAWGEIQCRIKGKILGTLGEDYNPLAPGDVVDWEPNPLSEKLGLITSRHPRRTLFQRWNKKGRAPQTFAANVDVAVMITVGTREGFRPRFVDRGLIVSDRAGIEPLILVNKLDLGLAKGVEERMDAWTKLGYTTLAVSAAKGTHLGLVRSALSGKVGVLSGQSGVGKSTLINALFPQAAQKTGDLSRKYNRGVHTTNFARLFPAGEFSLVDTPGIREFELWGLDSQELEGCFSDFDRYRGDCSFQPCTHREEPGCAVKQAAMEGFIHPDRFENYLKLFEELEAGEVYGP